MIIRFLEWFGIVFLACILWVKIYVPLSRDLNRGWSQFGQSIAEIGK